jgi:hypothetical protein
MTLETVIQVSGIIITFLGLLLIWYQIKSERKDSMTSSFISAVADHWMLLEERRMQIRAGEMAVSYRLLPPRLEELLSAEYQGDLSAFAKDFLYIDDSQLAELVAKGKDEVLNEVSREYAFEDMLFNFYEEEFVAGKYMRLVDKKLWGYWEGYIRQGFRSGVRQNHWRLRQAVGRTFPEFVRFVEKQYLL